MTVRKAEAQWTGSLREGRGEIALESGAFRGPYTFKARFEDGKETNPEELLGAAHAACFTMALTALLARQQLAPTKIHTTASVHIEQVAGGFSIPRIDLRTRATIPGHRRREVRGPRGRCETELPRLEGAGRSRNFARRETRMTASILYGNRESGHCYKVKLALVFAELLHEYREVDLDVPFAERHEDFRAVSRFGEVPVFVDGNMALAQSNAILLYIAERSGKLGGELPQEQLTEWLFWEANRIGFSIPNLRAARTYAGRPIARGPGHLARGACRAAISTG